MPSPPPIAVPSSRILAALSADPRLPMRRRWMQLAGAGLLVHALPGCGGDGDAPDDAARLAPAIAWGRQSIIEAMAQTDASAVSVALMTRQGVIWQEAFGMVDREAGIAATTRTRFNIGSVSKVLAAMAAMILCDRGLASLDDPIVRYMPGFTMLSDGFRQITMRQLLSHSSGLPGTNARNSFTFAPVEGYALETERGLAYFHLKHTPGELAVYCNDGFTLIERIVQSLTGLSYPAFVHNEILAPLGMDDSSYALQPLPEGAYAHPYHEGQRMGQEFVNVYASGGLISTPGDMMKLAALFLNQGRATDRSLLSPAAIREMGTDQTLHLPINPSPEWRWGLGWDSVRQLGLAAAGIDAWQKNGGTAFYATEFFVLPRHGMALLLTGAGRDYNPTRLAEGILLRALASTDAITAVPSQIPLAASAASATSDMAGVQGIYGNFLAPIKVQVNDGAIDLLRWQDGGWASLQQGLTQRNDGWWHSDGDPAIGYRWETVQGLHYLMERHVGGAGHYHYTLPAGQRLMPLAPLSQAWMQRAGTVWDIINESPDSVALRLGSGACTLDILPDLPGYVFWDGGQLLIPENDQRANMAVRIPVNNGRDLAELQFETQDGQELLRVGTSLYRRRT